MNKVVGNNKRHGSYSLNLFTEDDYLGMIIRFVRST